MIDPRHVDKPYPERRYAVGVESIREYAAATLDPGPYYGELGPALVDGPDDQVAPPMFAVVYSLRLFIDMLFDADLGLDLARVVHGEQAFEFIDLARPGDVILSSGRIATIFEKRGNDFVVFESSSRCLGGGELLRGRWTFVVRAAGSRLEAAQGAAPDLEHPWLTPGSPPAGVSRSEWSPRGRGEAAVGQAFGVERAIDRYRPLIYAGAAGDYNPIHIDPAYGEHVGLGGNILQGLCTMAFAAQAAVEFARDPRALRELRVRFASPVRPGDTVRVGGEVAALTGERAQLRLRAENQRGAPVLTHGEAVVALSAASLSR